MTNAELQAAFDREFREHLERFTEPVVAALRKLVETPLLGEFEVLSFEQQADWRYFPVRAFAMDRETVDIDQDRYEAAGVATFESGARVLAEWFGECWHAAGGAHFPLPAYINLHDSSRYYDLHARRWMPANTIGR